MGERTAGVPSQPRLRVVFVGNDAWSVPVLEALAAAGHRPTQVLTRDPRPAGRGRVLTPTSVAEAARRLGLPLLETPTITRGEGFDALRTADPDVMVVVAYGEILPRAVLDVPEVAPLNVHFSLLPTLRGAAPVQRAILEGHQTTGVTVMEMDEGLDTGPILAQTETPIEPDEDTGMLGARLATLGGSLLVDALQELAGGRDAPREQDDEAATYAPKLRPEERVIDWAEGAEQIVRRIRAFAPEPGATTTRRSRRLKILRAQVQPVGWAATPPTVGSLSVGPDGVPWVGAGDRRTVALLEVAPEGRPHMTGQEFVRGYRPEPGERLG